MQPTSIAIDIILDGGKKNESFRQLALLTPLLRHGPRYETEVPTASVLGKFDFFNPNPSVLLDTDYDPDEYRLERIGIQHPVSH